MQLKLSQRDYVNNIQLGILISSKIVTKSDIIQYLTYYSFIMLDNPTFMCATEYLRYYQNETDYEYSMKKLINTIPNFYSFYYA